MDGDLEARLAELRAGLRGGEYRRRRAGCGRRAGTAPRADWTGHAAGAAAELPELLGEVDSERGSRRGRQGGRSSASLRETATSYRSCSRASRASTGWRRMGVRARLRGPAAAGRDLLREHAAVRSEARFRFRSIMVDEFQDTNRLQWAARGPALGRDSRERAEPVVPAPDLFFVGDEFQSIYRFRHADVDVFGSVERRAGECSR